MNPSVYLWAIVIAWVVAYIIKYFVALYRGQRLRLTRQIVLSGGMPSQHVATSMALWMVILLKDGWQSGLFALSTLLVFIVAHDAVKVRRSSGEQGVAITELIHETKSKVKIPYVAKGHTALEILIGGILGAVIGLVVFLATR